MGNIQNNQNSLNDLSQDKFSFNKQPTIFDKLNSIKLFFTKQSNFFNTIYDPLNDSSNDEIVIDL